MLQRPLCLSRRYFGTRRVTPPPHISRPTFLRQNGVISKVERNLARPLLQSEPPPRPQIKHHRFPRNGHHFLDMAPRRKHDEIIAGDDPDRKRKVSERRIKKLRKSMPDSSSSEDVLWLQITELLGTETVERAVEQGTEFAMPFAQMEEIEVEVVRLCGNATGLGFPTDKDRRWVVAIPYVFPGEIVRCKVYATHRMHAKADFLEVIKPNPEYRDESLVKCKYFRSCSGCQYQMVPYSKQMDIKRNVVVDAYKHYSDLDASDVPEIGETVESPLQYGYRTKLTPHFTMPKKRQAGDGFPNIGFNATGRPGIIDIEDCPIATPAINEEIPRVRKHTHENIDTFKLGATLLFRDSLELTQSLPLSSSLSDEERDQALNKKVCITNPNGSIRERVGDSFFEYSGSSFFQNNNSVLVKLTEFTRDAIFPDGLVDKPTHLIDTYCGAGLFGITLAKYFDQVSGIELSPDSIMYAKRNARLNGIPSSKISFRKGDATDIFGVVDDFPPNQTAIVIDPPRKGCSKEFIDQVVKFAPQTVVYVSCNVHSQARDVGMILRAMRAKEGGKKYVLESVRGFDLFPQTHHVEGVAVLRLADA